MRVYIAKREKKKKTQKAGGQCYHVILKMSKLIPREQNNLPKEIAEPGLEPALWLLINIFYRKGPVIIKDKLRLLHDFL